jgi:hypothetical protein
METNAASNMHNQGKRSITKFRKSIRMAQKGETAHVYTFGGFITGSQYGFVPPIV